MSTAEKDTNEELRDLQPNPTPLCGDMNTATTDVNGIQPETLVCAETFQDKDSCEIASTLKAKGLIFTAGFDLYSKNKTTYRPHCAVSLSFLSTDLPVARSVEFCKKPSDNTS